jgi:type I restriction enzyme R subunit
VDEKKLRNLMAANLTEANINEFGRFDDLKAFVDKAKAREYFEKLDNTKMPPFKINIKVHNLLQEFILKGGFDIEEPVE